MALWCRDLPVVTVRTGEMPKRVTFVYPYYNNPEFLLQQVATWRAYPDDLKAYLTVIVVDDCSKHSAEDALRHVGPPCALRMYRIDVDKRWNWLAARNVGAHHADDGWLLLTDMDHIVPEATLRSVVSGEHDRRVIYTFSRREHTGEAVTPHSASFLMTRAMFWSVGGYDERLSGYYGTDGDWRRRCSKVAPLQVLTDELVRWEYVRDSSTTDYLRKQPQDATVKHLIAQRGPKWTPQTLSFPYHEVRA